MFVDESVKMNQKSILDVTIRVSAETTCYDDSINTQMCDLKQFLCLSCCFRASPESSELVGLLFDLCMFFLIYSELSDGAHRSHQFDFIRLQTMLKEI